MPSGDMIRGDKEAPLLITVLRRQHLLKSFKAEKLRLQLRLSRKRKSSSEKTKEQIATDLAKRFK